MSHTPVIIKVGDVRLAAVFKTEELDQGIEMLMDVLSDKKPCAAAKKIIIGPASSATDALLHNERCEKKAKEKGVTTLRANDYEENRKKVFLNGENNDDWIIIKPSPIQGGDLQVWE